jgi:hypothetical protein
LLGEKLRNAESIDCSSLSKEPLLLILLSGVSERFGFLLTTGHAMAQEMEKIQLKDNGGRRSGKDRRVFSYAGYLPERRTGNERRSGLDRRKVIRYQTTFND